MRREHFAVWYTLLVFLLFVIAVSGYVGYVLYPRFDLPVVSGVGILVLAGAAGVASFFSPCSFPLLTALLARELGDGDPILRALRFGFALSAGTSLFLMLVGGGIVLGAGTFFESVTFTSTEGRLLRFIVGSVLVFLGLVQWQVFSLPFDRIARLTGPIQRLQIKLRKKHPTFGFGILGFGYVLGGFG